MIILTIATITLITIQTYNQYKKVTITANKKIAEIIGIIINQDPEIDTGTIIKTLNSKQDTEEYQKGQETTAMGFIAGFVGKEIEEQVQKYGVKTDFIKIENNNSRINVKILEEKSENRL